MSRNCQLRSTHSPPPCVCVLMSTALRWLTAAHTLQRWLAIARDALCCMLSCLPARLQRVFSGTTSTTASTSGMGVTTRRQRANASSMHEIVQRLQAHPPAQQPHQPLSSKLAAVLVPLFQSEDGSVRVWLTQRATHLNSHSGEVCLPGGKRDESDPDDAFTAKREVFEELGLPPADVQVLCHMPPMLSKHLLSVTPVVAQVPSSFVPQPNPSEVQAVFSMPLSAFLDSQRHLHWDVRSKSSRDTVYRVHSFDFQGQIVWGLTAAILIEVAQVALGRPPDFEVDHPGSRAAVQRSNQSRM